MTRKNNAFFNKFLLGAVAFFLLALGGSAYIFFGGVNTISSSNLDVKIVSPNSVSSGEELDLGMTIINGNRADLSNVTLYITYPSGSQSVGVNSAPLSRDQVTLGTIASGGNSEYTLRTLLFGEKDSVKTFNFRIEYQVKGSNATFSKETTYDVSIGSSPLLINVDYPKEINSGQTIQLTVDVTSNSSVVVKNTLVKIEYPYGFTYATSNLKPLQNNSVWSLGDLKNGDKKTLVISGVLLGQDQEDRSFRVSVGTGTNGSPNDFSTSLAEMLATIGIRKSFFALSATAPDFGVPGQPAIIQIKWQNTLPDKILGSTIQATISGNAADRNAVNTGSGGFFRSVDNTVLWDQTGNSSLAQLLPGDAGQVSLSMGVLSEPSLRAIKNPHINLHVQMSGDRSGASSGKVSSTADVEVRIRTTASLSAKSFRSSGPFANSGPIPPRADQESTYTVTWTITNTTNDLKDTVVSATLPPGVEWKGQVSPTGEKITYAADSRIVSWNASNVSAGTGFNLSPRQVSFKVGITPSVNQVNQTAPLTSDASFSATDTYTDSQINQTAQGVTTLASDPGFSSTQGTVTK